MLSHSRSTVQKIELQVERYDGGQTAVVKRPDYCGPVSGETAIDEDRGVF